MNNNPPKDIQMQLRSGDLLSLLKPDPNLMTCDNIIPSLFRTGRWANQGTISWSVGQHSLLCAATATALRPACGKAKLVKLCALHDAHEAFTGDLTSPLKNLVGTEISDLQSQLDIAIGKAFNINLAENKSLVKKVDIAVLLAEAKILLPGGPSQEYTWPQADPDLVDFALSMFLPILTNSQAEKTLMEIFLNDHNKNSGRVLN